MDKRRACITGVLLILGIGIYAGSTLYAKKSIPVVTVGSTFTEMTEDSSGITEPSEFPVYICGAVNQPGIYETDRPVYLFELVQMAGGLSECADEKHIDLVYYIDSPQSIYIPSLDEYEDESVTDLFIPDNEGGYEKKGEERSGKIDINSADTELLSTLPGIGEKTAQKIVNYRETNGRFTCTEDIMKVQGIGESKYEAIKDLILAG